jgi:hypothetical protein
MKNCTHLVYGVVVLLIGCFTASQVTAGTIFLSGDSNIGNAIDGSWGVPINPNNGTWFSNILGAGTSVKIQSGFLVDSIGASITSIDSYYNSLSNVTSSIVPATTSIDDTLLTDIDLYISVLPSDDFTSAELNSFSNFLSSGGSIFFLGEYDGYANWNARINSALVDLGSNMSIVNDLVDIGVNITTNIELDPYNLGVTDFTYGSISTTSGGIPLIRSLDATTFIAYENISAVPLPAAAWLFLSGLACMVGVGLRR